MPAEPLVSQPLTPHSGVPGTAGLTSGPQCTGTLCLLGFSPQVTPGGTSSRAGPDVPLSMGPAAGIPLTLSPNPFPTWPDPGHNGLVEGVAVGGRWPVFKPPPYPWLSA